MLEPKYPHVTVNLIGHDSNAMSILGNCTRTARLEGVPQEELDTFFEEATSGNYERVCISIIIMHNIILFLMRINLHHQLNSLFFLRFL